MDALKSYLYTALLAALVSSIAIRLSEPRYRKFIRFVAGLGLLLTVTAPLIGLTNELASLASEPPDITYTEGNAQYMDAIGKEMSVQIGDMVASRYHIPREKIWVNLSLDLTDLSAISLVSVVITIDYPCNQQAISDYFTTALGCPAEVITIGSQ